MVMTPLPVAASTLVNACGTGWASVRRALREDTSGLRRNDFEPAASLDTWIGRVTGLEDAALPPALAQFDCRNNRLALACLEQDNFGDAVRAACANTLALDEQAVDTVMAGPRRPSRVRTNSDTANMLCR